MNAYQVKGYVVDMPHHDAKSVIKNQLFKDKNISVMYMANLPEVVKNETKFRLKILRKRVGAVGKSDKRSAKGVTERALKMKAERAEVTKRKRLEFLYPAGPRSPGGKHVPAGVPDDKVQEMHM